MTYVITCPDCGAQLLAPSPLDRIECVGDGSHLRVEVVRYSPISGSPQTGG